jgi:hypothetical protein
MDLEIAYRGQTTTARIFWRRFDDDKHDSKKSLSLELRPDGSHLSGILPFPVHSDFQTVFSYSSDKISPSPFHPLLQFEWPWTPLGHHNQSMSIS